MKHERRHTLNRLKKKYKHLAAAVAGVAILAGASLPGTPAVTAHASAKPITQKAPDDSSLSVDDTTAAALTKEKAGNAPANYKKVLDVRATAYAPGPHDNDQWGDKTYLGTQIRPGIIAVDPRVIPLKSKVYIQYPDGHGEYAIAEDTGGAIKGNRIDIAKWTVAEAEKFGIQQVKVFVV